MCQEKMSKQELNKFKRAFEIFDIDGDGTFSTQELSDVMKSLGGYPPWAVLQDMIDKADSDRNGQIDFPEFLMLMNGYNTNKEGGDNKEDEKERLIREREEELCDMFRIFDTDGTGFITSDELARVMTRFSGLTQAEVNVMLSDADIDGDGGVEYEEFVEMMRRPTDEPMRRRLSEIWNSMMMRNPRDSI